MRNKTFRQMMKDIQSSQVSSSKKRSTSATPAMAAPYGRSAVMLAKYEMSALVAMKVGDLKALAKKEGLEIVAGSGAKGSVIKTDYIYALAELRQSR